MNKAMLLRGKVSKLTGLISEKKIKVLQRGTRAYVEYNKDGTPKFVNLPYIPDSASSGFIAAIEGFLDHEVAHILFTDFKAIKRAASSGVKTLHNIIEDTYIERRMEKTFPGAALNLRNVGEWFLKEYTDAALVSGKDAFGVLIVPAIRAWSGQQVHQEYMRDKWHLLGEVGERIRPYAEKALPNIKSSNDAVDAAIKIKELIGEMGLTGSESDKGSEGGEGEEGDKGSTKKGKGASKPKSSTGEEVDPGGKTTKGSSPSPVDEVPHAPPAKEDTAAEEGAEEVGGAREGPIEEKGEGGEKGLGQIMEGIESFDDVLSKLVSDFAKVEIKDSDYFVYSTDYDKILPLPIIDGVDTDDLSRDVDHLIGPLQKNLERAIAAKSAAMWVGGYRSGKIHAPSLARLTATGDTRAFKRKHTGDTKDVAVTLLIDMSGSMLGREIEVAAKAAYGLASVLERLNISYEVLGFTTNSRLIPDARSEMRGSRSYALRTYIIKDFTCRFSIESKKRLASLCTSDMASYLNENVDGESVLIAASRLAARREKRKILMVLSDGQPACPPNKGLRTHLKKAVQLVEKSGIETLGIGILTEAPKDYYPRHVVLNDVNDLPTTVIAQIKKLLLSP